MAQILEENGQQKLFYHDCIGNGGWDYLYYWRVPMGGKTASLSGTPYPGTNQALNWSLTDIYQAWPSPNVYHQNLGKYDPNGWSVLSDGAISIHYINGDYCAVVGRNRASFVNYHCAATSSFTCSESPVCVCK